MHSTHATIDRASNDMLHITEEILLAMKIRHFENAR